MKLFSDLSLNITQKLSKEEKKNDGIFFTPLSIINKNISLLEKYLGNIKSILEPSCGSCQYIDKLIPYNIKITGIEYNKKIYDNIKDIYNTNKIKIVNADFLEYKFENKVDLIIGNPPYYVMKKEKVNKELLTLVEGRPNIFILFIIKSLKLLNENGILSFILPVSFMNCIYYNKLRIEIIKNYTILNIVDCNIDDDYIDTKQETLILIVQNKKPNETDNIPYYLKVNNITILADIEYINKLKLLYNNSSTLKELKCSVKIGELVWNQKKDILTNDDTKTLLIYSSNIVNNNLEIKEFDNIEKKQYINKNGMNEPILIINRGYGNGDYNFNYCLIDIQQQYLLENHIIYIKNNDITNKDDLISFYKTIIQSFENSKTKEFIKLYFRNNGINKEELYNILPIYI